LTLNEIPRGARVFLDAGIFLHHFSGSSAECRQLLERCERSEVRGVTSALVLAEVAHRLGQMEAAVRGHLGPTDLLRLHDDMLAKIPLMGVEVLPLDLRVLLAAGALGSRAALPTFASLVAGGAREAGLELVATVAGDLERVEGLRVCRPADLD
jgi:predicted nucleic acid-binding protein